MPEVVPQPNSTLRPVATVAVRKTASAPVQGLPQVTPAKSRQRASPVCRIRVKRFLNSFRNFLIINMLQSKSPCYHGGVAVGTSVGRGVTVGTSVGRGVTDGTAVAVGVSVGVAVIFGVSVAVGVS